MTQAQAVDIHTKWKQQGEPLCEHPIQELTRLARSEDGVLLGTYHCRACGEAITYIHTSPPFSNTPDIVQRFARCVLRVKTGIRTMLFGQLPRGSMPKQGEDKHNDGQPAPVAERS